MTDQEWHELQEDQKRQSQKLEDPFKIKQLENEFENVLFSDEDVTFLGYHTQPYK